MKTIDEWNVESAVEYLKEVIALGQIPGATLSVVTGDDFKTVVLGNAQLVPTVEPLREGMLYDLASLSKVVSTTSLILLLIDEGKLSLETRVSEVLAGFRHESITIRHLLTHTSGLLADNRDYKKLGSKVEFVDLVMNSELSYESGTKVVYSDLGYLLLGLILERFGKIDELAERFIFGSLGMNDTMYRPRDRGRVLDCVPTEVVDGSVVRGVVHDGKASLMDGVAGHAGLFSTASDLSQFVMSVLNEEMFSKEIFELLKKSQTVGLNESRTLGWIASNQSTLYHTGFSGTSLYIDFDRGCGVVLLTNRVHPTRNNGFIEGIRERVHSLLLGDYDY